MTGITGARVRWGVGDEGLIVVARGQGGEVAVGRRNLARWPEKSLYKILIIYLEVVINV